MLPRTADVVIIGAGVIGAAIAHGLAARKLRPVVLERGDTASGSSGACEAMLLLQSKKPGIHLKLAMASLERFARLAHSLPGDIEYEKKGGLVIMENPAESAALKDFVARQRAGGVDLISLSARDACKMEPTLSPDIAGATFSPIDAQVNPMALTLAFLKAAGAGGAIISPHTPVRAVTLDKGRVTGVVTERGTISTPRVINATGACAAEIGRMVGLTLPITPRRGQILVTEWTPPRIFHCILSAKYIAAKFDPAIAAAGGMGFALEQTASGTILIGSTREFVGFDCRNTFSALQTIASNILRVFPGLDDLHVIRAFSGLRPYTPDGLPILGEAATVPGFFIAAGHEGDGITLSAITGELMADLITGNSPAVDLSPFRPERFAGADTAGVQHE